VRLSPSFARTVEECTLRARWLRIDEAPRAVPEIDEPLRYGSAAHTALERVFLAVVAEDAPCDLTSDDWRTRTDEAIAAAIVEHGPFSPTREEELRRIVHEHAATLGTVAGRDVLGTELFLRWKAGEDTPVVGFADRVDRLPGDRVRVVDYKTGRGAFPPETLSASLQFRTYAVAAASRFPWAEEIEVEVAQLDRREVTRTSWTREDLDTVAVELAERYVAADARVTEGPWEPTVGRWCGICEFVALCPAKGGTPAPGTWDPTARAIVGADPSLFDGTDSHPVRG